MPFLNQIAGFINDSLKAGSLNKKNLQPAKFHALSTIVYRSTTDKKQGSIEPVPAIVDEFGKITLITPNSGYALQVYHRLLSNTYSYEKKSHGDDYYIRCISELNLVVFTNSKLSGRTKDVLEPVFVFGMPQRLSTALTADLGINSCSILPLSSNMDDAQVYGQEFPRSNYFLTEQLNMFSIRYRTNMLFSQACINRCCDEDEIKVISTEDLDPILTESGAMIPVEE